MGEFKTSGIVWAVPWRKETTEKMPEQLAQTFSTSQLEFWIVHVQGMSLWGQTKSKFWRTERLANIETSQRTAETLALPDGDTLVNHLGIQLTAEEACALEVRTTS